VIDSLSFCANADASRISETGSPHVSLPRGSLLTRMPLPKSLTLNDSAIWYASPFGEKVTHGSVARS
jgi:hypothetical protein